MLLVLCPWQLSSCFCCTVIPSPQAWKETRSLAPLALYCWFQGIHPASFPLLFCFQPPLALDFLSRGSSASKPICSSPCYLSSTGIFHIHFENIPTNCSLLALLWIVPDVASDSSFPLASTPSVWVRSSTKRAPAFLQMLWSNFN